MSIGLVRRMVLVAMVGAALITSTAGPAGAQAAGDAEGSFLAYVNTVRSAQGMSALPMAADLVSVARAHSADMAAAGRLFHSANLGQQVQQWIAVAENVGAGATVDQIDQALMASSVHRGDILNPRYTDIGVGVVSSGGTLWLTEIFRQRAGTVAEPATPPPPTSPPVTEAPAPAPEPAPVAAPPTTATAARPVRTAAAPVRPRSTPTTATPTTVAPPTTEPPVPEFAPAEAPAPAVVELAAPAAEVNLGAVAPAAVEPTAAKPALVAGGLMAIALLWLVAFKTIRLAVARRRPAYLHRIRPL